MAGVLGFEPGDFRQKFLEVGPGGFQSDPCGRACRGDGADWPAVHCRLEFEVEFISGGTGKFEVAAQHLLVADPLDRRPLHRRHVLGPDDGVVVDKVDTGRVLDLQRVSADSNSELRLTFNSSAFGPGEYRIRLQGYTWRGQRVDAGWVRLLVK